MRIKLSNGEVLNCERLEGHPLPPAKKGSLCEFVITPGQKWAHIVSELSVIK